MIGIAIGNYIGNQRVRYWPQRLSFWGKGRSGLTIPDVFGNNGSILPLCGYTNGTNSFIKAPAATKDWSFTEMTHEIIFDFPIKPSAITTIMARNQSGVNNGDYALAVNLVSTKPYFFFYRKGGGAGDNWTGSDELSATTKYHVIITQSVAGGVTIYVNGVSKGTLTYSAIPVVTSEPFVVGAVGASGTPSSFTKMNIQTTRVYNVCLTPSELTQRWALTDVTRGLILAWDYMGGDGSSTEHDRSGTGNHGTWVGTSPYYKYSANGCQDNLNNGYKRYFKTGYFPLFLPKLIGSSNYPSSLAFPTGFNEWGEIAGSSLVHNLSGSALRLPDFDVFDRSDTTTNNASSRAANSYDSGNVRDWDIWEAINYNVTTSYLNTGYQAMMGAKNTWLAGADEISRPIALQELLLCIANQTGSALNRFLSYTDND